jgi:ribosomal-protein-alanine N-acetyltransferase
VSAVQNACLPRLETTRLILVPHEPAHLVALAKSIQEYERLSGFRAAEGLDEFTRAGSPEFHKQLQNASSPDPWLFGFGIIHRAEKLLIGSAGFTGPPGPDGVVEIGYGIAPGYQRQGYATEATKALLEFIRSTGKASIVRAHTLPELNASARVLTKCGFARNGEAMDPDEGVVWRWERSVE